MSLRRFKPLGLINRIKLPASWGSALTTNRIRQQKSETCPRDKWITSLLRSQHVHGTCCDYLHVPHIASHWYSFEHACTASIQHVLWDMVDVWQMAMQLLVTRDSRGTDGSAVCRGAHVCPPFHNRADRAFFKKSTLWTPVTLHSRTYEYLTQLLCG